MELCQYPCMGNVREFHITAIHIPIVYNKYGDMTRQIQGRMSQ